MQLHISIAAEKIAEFLGITITNSLLTTWIVMAFIMLFAFFATKSIQLVPKGVQNFTEALIGGLYDFFKSITGEDKIKDLFPLIASLFIFILISNWAGLIPGLSAIGFNEAVEEEHAVVQEQAAEQSSEVTSLVTPSATTQVDAHGQPVVIDEHVEPPIAAVEVHEEAVPAEAAQSEKKHATFVPLFRGPTADLNTTVALALISVGSMIYFGIKYLGLAFFKRYLDFSNPIMFFVGVLEIISDISKILSFAFRLFGNVFAGEVLLAVIGFLTLNILAPIPFLGLELFVGVIQALVFAMLTAVFISMAATGHGDHGHEDADHGDELEHVVDTAKAGLSP